MEASGPRMEGFLSIGVEGTWKACVCGLVVSEGGRKDNGVATGEE
jgi:hypothetical protein